ncbi:MAG: asparagine synthase (glutamine-hydrolyzing) [Acidobacteriia bacterium]|nr:asparagine synthase (glutamine-hydrolyzing) [Terriglobia bacterium]
MCGFVGIQEADGLKPVARSTLEQMLRPILHRGPDGTGFHEEPGLGLAVCRLAIIDVEHGDQPMANDDGQLWIVFNGEIYNYRQLRQDLESRGRRFRTSSDTEVLLLAYEEWGRNCVRRLRGIFAFAIWDWKERELFLARDHSGIKPLSLALEPDRTLFASEAKALLSQRELRRGIDLIGYLGATEDGEGLIRSPFRGIVELAPGCTLLCKGGGRTISRYWSYEPSREAGRQDERLVLETFQSLVHEAVGMQLVADVPIAASLSGGVDSATIVTSMALHGRRDVRTYTVEFEGDATRDSEHAQVVAAFLGVENVRVPCGFGGVRDIARTAWFAEGEFDLGYVARQALAQAVYADGAKVLLSGQGIDEILTGYFQSYKWFRRRALRRRLLRDLSVSFREWPLFAWEPLDEEGERLAAHLGGDPERWWAELTATQLARDFRRLGSGWLRFEDRMGMAGHVEVRVPFLDHRLLEFCASIPEGNRVELFSGKRILRAAASRFLPPQISLRPKVAFNASAAPLSKLVLENGTEMMDLLEEPAVEERGWFDWNTVQGMKANRNYKALDHVLILHLLDELFIRRYDATRWSSGLPRREASRSGLKEGRDAGHGDRKARHRPRRAGTVGSPARE